MPYFKLIYRKKWMRIMESADHHIVKYNAGKRIRESGIRRSGTLLNCKNQYLACTDDTANMTRTEANLVEALKELEHAAKNKELRINENKTMYMELRNRDARTISPNDLILTAKDGTKYNKSR